MSSGKEILEVDLQEEELTRPQKKYISDLRAQFSDELDLIHNFNLLVDKWQYRNLDRPYTPLSFIRDSVPLLKQHLEWIEHLTVFIGENYNIKCYPGTRDPKRPNDWPSGHIIVTLPNGTRIYSTSYVRVPISWHYENLEMVKELEGKRPPPPGRGFRSELVSSGRHYVIKQAEERRTAAEIQRSQVAPQPPQPVNPSPTPRPSAKEAAKAGPSRRSNAPSPPESVTSLPEPVIAAPSKFRATKKTFGQGARHDLLLAQTSCNATATRTVRKTTEETAGPQHDREETTKLESGYESHGHSIVPLERSAPQRLVDQRRLPPPIPSRYAYPRNMNVEDPRYQSAIFQSNNAAQNFHRHSPPTEEHSRSVRYGQQDLSREILDHDTHYRREMRVEHSRYGPVLSARSTDQGRLSGAPPMPASNALIARDVRAMGPVSRIHLDTYPTYSYRDYPSSSGEFPPMAPKPSASGNRERSYERKYSRDAHFDQQSSRAPSPKAPQTPEEHYQAFIDSVREYFMSIDEEWIYKDFLAILRVYQNSKQGDNPMGDELACIEDMAYLFKDYPDFIVRFARCLGTHSVQCGAGWAQVRTPAGEVFKTTEDGHERPWESKYSVPPVYRPGMGTTASPRSSVHSKSVETRIKVEPDSD